MRRTLITRSGRTRLLSGRQVFHLSDHILLERFLAALRHRVLLPVCRVDLLAKPVHLIRRVLGEVFGRNPLRREMLGELYIIRLRRLSDPVRELAADLLIPRGKVSRALERRDDDCTIGHWVEPFTDCPAAIVFGFGSVTLLGHAEWERDRRDGARTA